MASSLKFAIAVLLLAYLYARLQHGWHLEESREAQMVRLGSKVVASDLLKRGRLWRDVTGGGERPRHNSLTNRPHWFLDSLLLLAGDIELNPGPKGKRLLEEPSSSSKRVKLDVKSSGSKSDDVEVRSSAAARSKRYQKAEPVTQRKRITPIGSLNPITRGWTIKARVLSEPNLTNWENDMKAGKVVNFYLADKTGDIKVYAYNEVAEELYSRLKAGTVYLISGGSIKPMNNKYSNVELEILLNTTTKIKTCQNDPDIPEVFNTYSFTDIEDVLESEPGRIIDVIGICEGSSGLTSTQNKTGDMIKQRVIRLKDKSGYIDCSLYESNAKDFDSSSNPVVAIKAGKVTGNASIDTGPSSAVQINPSLRKSKELKDWYCDENDVSTTPDYMQLYHQALAAETKVRLGIVQCMVVGPPQVGKTKLKKRLVGEDYSADDPSTGVADKPYVVVHTVHANKTNWRPLQFDTEKKLFLQRLSSSMQSAKDVDSVQHGNRDDASDEGISTQFLEKQGSKPPSPKNTGDDGISSSVEDTIPITEYEPSEEPVPYEEFITAVVEDTKQAEALAEKDVEDGCMIYFTDTGGQLEFQEVLPSIISGPAIFMIVFNLNDAISPNGLNKQFEVKYKSREGTLYTRGQEESVPTMSIKELILQTLASIHSTKHASTVSGKEITPKAILVGTHLDQVVKEEGGQLVEDEEAIKRVNNELKTLLKETDFHKDSLLVYPSKNAMFFKVNNEIPDHRTFDEIKQKIGSIAQEGQENSLYVEDVPFSWLAFDIKLRTSNKQLLSLSECVELAKSCGLEYRKHEVTGTLKFLQRRFGFIRWISNLDMVITNPQIIYDSITDLVVESFCENDPGTPNRGDCEMFKEKGLIPVGVLQELHKKDIIPLEKLLKLLDNLNVVVTVEEDEHGEPSMYFMPSVLAHAPRADNNPQVQPIIAELLVGFRCERCPKGVFSALLANLSKLQDDQNDKSMYKWCLNVRDPYVSLYRDLVSFEIFEPNEESSVRVYVSVSKCITISIRPQDQEACTRSTVCNNVFRKVGKCMQLLCNSLAYEGYYLGFYCKNGHIAKFHGERPKQMICAKCKKSYKYDLEVEHLHWFKSVQSSDLKLQGECCDDWHDTAQSHTNTGSTGHCTSTPIGMTESHHLSQFCLADEIVFDSGEVPCDSAGIEHTIQGHDITLKVPKGAVPVGTTLTLEYAVKLSGPFTYPPNMRPISATLWMCHQEKTKLLKPIEVTMPHIIRPQASTCLEELEIGFAKANHSVSEGKHKFVLLTSEKQQNYSENNISYRTLYTTHCCFLCILSKDIDHKIAQNAGFCLSTAVSRPFKSPVEIHVIASYHLRTCLKLVKSQFPSCDYELDVCSTEFMFEEVQRKTLEMKLIEPTNIDNIRRKPVNLKIYFADIDFYKAGHDRLELKCDLKRYPPRLLLETHCNLSPKVRLAFDGILDGGFEKVELELLLAPATGDAALHIPVRPTTTPKSVPPDSNTRDVASTSILLQCTTEPASTESVHPATGTSTDFYPGVGLSEKPIQSYFSTTFWGLETKHSLTVEAADDSKMEVDPSDATKIRQPIIAILDTGIYKEHAAFTKDGRCKVIMEDSRSFIDEANRDCIEDTDPDGHGTACAGIAGGFNFEIDDKIRFPGGVAPNAKLIICRVANSRHGYGHDPVASALLHLIKLNNDRGSRGIPYVDVLSMSFGSSKIIPGKKTKSEFKWSDLLTQLTSQGTICVAAAGNSGDREEVNYPAFLGCVISVGSHDCYGRLSNSSQDDANVYALGVDVNVPSKDNERSLVSKSGTSTAAPAIAGLIARLIEHGHHHFSSDTEKLKCLHNSDIVLTKILKPMCLGGKRMLHPKHFFDDFEKCFNKLRL